MSGILTWFAYARAATTEPAEFFESLDVDGYGIPISFSLLSVTVAAYLAAVVRIVETPTILHSSPDLLFLLFLGVVTGLIGGVIVVPIWSAVTHAVITVLGGDSYQQTVVASAYATAVYAFLGWIPIVRFLALAYLLYVQFVGIQRLHGLEKKHAAAAVVVPTVLMIGAGVTLHAFFPALYQTAVTLPDQITIILQNLVM